ncbi:MAG: 2-amino-4-hydroxy-6-hydroxymethyldihydropteridine diphosphokinase [Deltaproteobacteria bacterium]|nr:2-amino-4-hydroxy-6-hydroxymethyldihydropteridine diphosphokinase [Deltaproteobacteria bacterium]
MAFTVHGSRFTVLMRVFISIGSNAGDREANCLKAVELLGANVRKARVVKRSSLYETEPWGLIDQEKFINSVVEMSTALEPDALLEFLKSIESTMGRRITRRWGERIIDLDIIFYGGLVYNGTELVIPHPFVHERAFVLVPLEEIAPEFVHPVSGKTVAALARVVSFAAGVRRIN